MKKIALLNLVLIIVLTGVCQTVSAQFPIKIPKIGKQKKEEPKTEPPTADTNQTESNTTKTDTNSSVQKQGEPNNLDDPERPKIPRILLETLEIKAHNETKYWKTPANNDNPSWFPQVSFDVFYAAKMPVLRFTAEWTNPDGSLWFSEPLEMTYGDDFPGLRSPYESKDIEPKAIIAVGTYGLKITDSKNESDDFSGQIQSQ